MEGHLPLEGQGSASSHLEIQSDQNSPSNSDLGLLSPSLTQQFNNVYEPLIRPALPPRPSLTTLNTGHEYLSRRPVLPPRPSSISSTKKFPENVELQQLTPGDSDPLDSLNDKPASIAPKAFRKTYRFLGFNLGYWRQPARHFSIFSVLALVTIIPLYFVGASFQTLQGYTPPPFMHDCYQGADGWSFVGINLRFGYFNYGSAKALDLAWNWIVGRGVQVLLTLLAYRVFNDALLRAAEMTPLSFDLYARLSLYTTRLDVLWHVLKALCRKGNWRTKAIFVWLIVSIIYVVTFPSLMDACSGYESTEVGFLQWPNGTLETTDDFANIEWDFNIFNATTVTRFYSTVAVCTSYCLDTRNNTAKPTNFTYSLPNMTLVEASSMGSRYMSVNTACSETDEAQCAGAVGDIYVESGTMALYYWQDRDLNSSWWAHFQSDPTTSQYGYWSEWGFYPTIADNFRCETQSGVYQWGFSYEWLFVAAIINSCWLIGLWILWLDCDTNSELCKKGRRLGLWRAVADISEAMREELGPNICAYSESELTEALKNRPPIKYYVKHGTEQEPGHIGLSSKSSGKVRLRWNYEYGSRDGLSIRQQGSLWGNVKSSTM